MTTRKYSFNIKRPINDSWKFGNKGGCVGNKWDAKVKRQIQHASHSGAAHRLVPLISFSYFLFFPSSWQKHLENIKSKQRISCASQNLGPNQRR